MGPMIVIKLGWWLRGILTLKYELYYEKNLEPVAKFNSNHY